MHVPQIIHHGRNGKKIKYQWKVIAGDTANIRTGIEDQFHKWGCLSYDQYTSTTTDDVLNQGLFGQGERDVFEVSLPNGLSFKYILHPKNQTPIIIGPRHNYKIVHSTGDIVVTDDSGIQYTFTAYTFNGKYAPLTYLLTEIKDTEVILYHFLMLMRAITLFLLFLNITRLAILFIMILLNGTSIQQPIKLLIYQR